jgi:hypothetical protein
MKLAKIFISALFTMSLSLSSLTFASEGPSAATPEVGQRFTKNSIALLALGTGINALINLMPEWTSIPTKLVIGSATTISFAGIYFKDKQTQQAGLRIPLVYAVGSFMTAKETQKVLSSLPIGAGDIYKNMGRFGKIATTVLPYNLVISPLVTGAMNTLMISQGLFGEKMLAARTPFSSNVGQTFFWLFAAGGAVYVLESNDFKAVPIEFRRAAEAAVSMFALGAVGDAPRELAERFVVLSLTDLAIENPVAQGAIEKLPFGKELRALNETGTIAETQSLYNEATLPFYYHVVRPALVSGLNALPFSAPVGAAIGLQAAQVAVKVTEAVKGASTTRKGTKNDAKSN